jgi:hypothetical protein
MSLTRCEHSASKGAVSGGRETKSPEKGKVGKESVFQECEVGKIRMNDKKSGTVKPRYNETSVAGILFRCSEIFVISNYANYCLAPRVCQGRTKTVSGPEGTRCK